MSVLKAAGSRVSEFSVCFCDAAAADVCVFRARTGGDEETTAAAAGLRCTGKTHTHTHTGHMIITLTLPLCLCVPVQQERGIHRQDPDAGL